MQERKIIRISKGKYQLLKRKENGDGWNNYGENKSIKAISDLLKKGGFALTTDEGIIYEISLYRRQCERKKEEYISKKGLESKTI